MYRVHGLRWMGVWRREVGRHTVAICSPFAKADQIRFAKDAWFRGKDRFCAQTTGLRNGHLMYLMTTRRSTLDDEWKCTGRDWASCSSNVEGRALPSFDTAVSWFAGAGHTNTLPPQILSRSTGCSCSDTIPIRYLIIENDYLLSIANPGSSAKLFTSVTSPRERSSSSAAVVATTDAG